MTNLEWIKSLDNYGMAKFLNDLSREVLAITVFTALPT